MTEHLGEDLELYPLGILDDDAARSVERHVASCSECAERVAQAQAVAASLAAALPRATPSPALERRLREAVRPQPSAKRRASLPFALAAAFALAILGFGWQALVLRERLAADDVALVTMVHSHFNHISMSPQSANPVAAKILYARDGSWIYIIADKPGGILHAIAHTAARSVDLGALASTGETATLLLHPRERIRSITLQRAGLDVASGTLAY
ncbi:MAG TPA: hypothetical protein VGG70_06920 [Candidatus Cybelea sp.]